MSKKLIPQILFLLMFATSALCGAETEEEMGQAAERAGRLREALAHYVSALQSATEGSTDDQRLREQIISIAGGLDPAPAVPEEAKRFMVRGETFFKEATSETDFAEAVNEFEQALHIAPWLPAGYFNRGLAEEGAGHYDRAINSFKLYLLSSPAAEDVEKVQEKIYVLEARWDKARRRQVEEAQKQEVVAPSELGGMWRDAQGATWRIAIVGQAMNIRQENSSISQWYEGTLNASSITGYRLQDFTWCRNGRLLKDSMTGTVSADGRTITLQASGEGPYHIGENDTITRWFHYEDSQVLTKIE